jgi:hypothetical protein
MVNVALQPRFTPFPWAAGFRRFPGTFASATARFCVLSPGPKLQWYILRLSEASALACLDAHYSQGSGRAR